MSNAFLYGNDSSTGSALTVTAPAGAMVIISKDGKTKTRTAGVDGVAIFKGLSSGELTLSITDGEQTSVPKPITITTDYYTEITFFAATIHVTYPAGSTCTATDGVTTLTAPDTSGAWELVVPNTGDWTVSLSNGFKQTITIEANGDIKTLDKWYVLGVSGDVNEDITGGFNSKAVNKVSSYYSLVRVNGVYPGASLGITNEKIGYHFYPDGYYSRDYPIRDPSGKTTTTKTVVAYYNLGCVSTINKIPVSGFTTLHANVSSDSDTTTFYVGLATSLGGASVPGDAVLSASVKPAATSAELTLDLSNLTEESYYLYVAFSGKTDDTGYIDAIWFE